MDIEKLISNAEKADQTLFDRIDRHIGLIENPDYVMRSYTGKTAPDVFHVHIDEAGLFLKTIMDAATSFKVDKVIEGLEGKKADYIKRFVDDYTEAADSNRMIQAQWGIYPQTLYNLFLQGWAVTQPLCSVEDDVLCIDIRTPERRNMVYGAGRNKIAWGAPVMRRSKYDIEAEYNHVISNEFGLVRDGWTDTTESVFVSDTDMLASDSIGLLVKEKENIYGCVPFVVYSAPTGSILMTDNGIENRGQGIFALLEKIFPEVDFNASILKTQSYEDLRPALQKPGAQETTDHYPAPGSVDSPEVPISLVPKRDMTNAQRAYMGLINDYRQRAGLSSIQHGSMTFPVSGVALMTMLKEKGSLITPYLFTLALALQGTHKLIIKQLRSLVDKKYIDPVFLVNGNEYDISKLELPHTLKYRFYSESLDEMAVKASVAQSYTGILPQKAILRDIIGRQNPELDDDQLEREAAERMFPELAMFEQMHSHIDESKEENDEHDISAKMILARLEVALEQMYAQPAPLEAQKRPEPLQSINLSGGGGNAQANAQNSQ